MKLVTAAAVLSIALCAAAGCSPDRPKNVLIVTLDTTRADRFGCYGYEKALTPNFDRFSAERAVRFEDAITAVPVTFPSHATIMSGTYPVFHGVHDNDAYVLDDDVTTLAEILKREGFATAAFIAAFPLDSQFNLDQGFDVYDHDFQADWSEAEKRSRTAFSFGFLERKSDLVNRAVARWLEEHWSERFFLWVHYFDPHQPYNPPRPYDSQFAGSLYDGEIAFMDENFGRLLEMLDAKGLREDTLIVVVGDHGESLGQHGEATHASYLYDPTMRVPLWIAAPGGAARPGTAVPSQVRTLDVAPTILDLLGMEIGAEMQGQSLVPLLEDPERDWNHDALLETHFPWYHYGWAPIRALRQNGWKYIEAPQPELYRVATDPDEIHNVIAAEPERAREMAQSLARLAGGVAADPGRSAATNVDNETLEKLRALGYIGGGGRNSIRTEPFPAPDKLVAMANPMQRALVLDYVNFNSEQLRQNLFDQAVDSARAGLAIDPTNYQLTVNLGRALAALTLYDDAMTHFRQANRLNPDATDALFLMGNVHLVQGDFEEAVTRLTEAVELNPGAPEILLALGNAYDGLGKYEQSIDIYRTALEAGDADWQSSLELAKAYARANRPQEARELFQRALERDPYSPSLLYNIGVFYRGLGDVAFSRTMFEATLRVAPTHLGANVLLAEQMLEGGEDPEIARPYLERVIESGPESAWAQRARDLLAGRASSPNS